MTVQHLAQVGAIEAQAYPFPWTEGNFVDALAAGYHGVCLVDAHDQLLAYLVAMDGVDEVHLLNLAVAPAAWGCGHARTLLDALVQRARAQSVATLWLEVRPSNERAHLLYLRYGFELVGRRRGYYPAAEGRREDALVMRLNIPAGDVSGVPHAVD